MGYVFFYFRSPNRSNSSCSMNTISQAFSVCKKPTKLDHLRVESEIHIPVQTCVMTADARPWHFAGRPSSHTATGTDNELLIGAGTKRVAIVLYIKIAFFTTILIL